MNAPRFLDWLENKLIPRLGRRAVIIMDNAPYHSSQTGRFPNSAWRVADMRAWCDANGVEHSIDNKKAMWTKLKALRDADPTAYGRYEVEAVCARHNIRVLRLPPYHSYMNPIEMIWAVWKRKVRLANMEHCNTSKASLAAIERIANEQFDAIPAEHSMRTFHHCLRLWRQYVNNETVHELIDVDADDDGGGQLDIIDEEDLEDLA
jgi:transposase